MASDRPAASAWVGVGLLGMAARCPVGGWTAHWDSRERDRWV